jgi:hypothetical protein
MLAMLDDINRTQALNVAVCIAVLEFTASPESEPPLPKDSQLAACEIGMLFKPCVGLLSLVSVFLIALANQGGSFMFCLSEQGRRIG